MIDVPLIDELREARRRLSQSCQEDLERYARMLQETATRLPGTYVTQPLGSAPATPSAPRPLDRVA
jgi:hypothetical protein